MMDKVVIERRLNMHILNLCLAVAGGQKGDISLCKEELIHEVQKTEDEVDTLREYYLRELDAKDAEIERLRAALRFYSRIRFGDRAFGFPLRMLLRAKFGR